MHSLFPVRFYAVGILTVFMFAWPSFAQNKGNATAAEAAEFITNAETRLSELSKKWLDEQNCGLPPR